GRREQALLLVRLLRYYEEQGLLTPARQPSGYRQYADTDVETVHRIRAMLAAGLGTSLIAQVLPCVHGDAGRIVPVCPELVGRLRHERDRVTESISELRNTQQMLDSIISAAAIT